MTEDARIIQFPGRDLEPRQPAVVVDADPSPVITVDVADRYVQGRLASLGEFGEWVSHVGWGAHMRAWLALFFVVRAPVEVGRLVRDSPRGLAVVVRVWARWVTGSRQTARIRLAVSSADVADAYADQRRDRIMGTVLSLAFIAATCVGTWLGWHRAPVRTVLAWLAVTVALGLVARWSRGERLVTTPQVPTGRAVTSAAIVDAMQPLCKAKDTTVRVLGVPHRRGDGWVARVQVPPGLTATGVVAGRAVIAQGLQVAEDRVTIDPLPMESADQVELYVADHHPMRVDAGPSPVLDADVVDVWQGIPIGTCAAGVVVLSMDESHVLIAGATGTGKTHVTRNILNGGLLDPCVEAVVWDFKAAGDFAPYGRLIKVHRGSDDRNVEAFGEWLTWLRGEVSRRGDAMDALVDSEETDDPKLTRWAAQRLGLRLLMVIVDEVQVPLGWGGDLGKQIAADLLFVARMGRAAGVRLILSTQRPDSGAIDSALRAQLPARICLRVDNPASSLAALGVRADAGWEADSLPADPKGAAIALGPGILPGATRFRAYESGIAEARLVVRRVEATRDPAPLASAEVQPTPARTLPEVLRCALAAWPDGDLTCHQDVLAEAMGWDQVDLGRALRALGIGAEQVKVRGVNRRGYWRDELDKAARG